MKSHLYNTHVRWSGGGEGTTSYRSYSRNFTIDSQGKPDIAGSSDPTFRGDATRYNPEELLVASLSSCHMLWYLHLCSVNEIAVLEYRDAATGDDGRARRSRAFRARYVAARDQSIGRQRPSASDRVA